jgi:hypothetical protein
MGAQILSSKSSGRLNFARWHLVFAGSQYDVPGRTNRAAGGEIMYRQMAYYSYRRYKIDKNTTSRVTLFLTIVVFNNFALTASWQTRAATHLIRNVATNLRLNACWETEDIIYEHSNKKLLSFFLWHKYFPPHRRAFCRRDALWDTERKIQNCRIKYTRGGIRLSQISDPAFRQPNAIRRATRWSRV